MKPPGSSVGRTRRRFVRNTTPECVAPHLIRPETCNVDPGSKLCRERPNLGRHRLELGQNSPMLTDPHEFRPIRPQGGRKHRTYLLGAGVAAFWGRRAVRPRGPPTPSCGPRKTHPRFRQELSLDSASMRPMRPGRGRLRVSARDFASFDSPRDHARSACPPVSSFRGGGGRSERRPSVVIAVGGAREARKRLTRDSQPAPELRLCDMVVVGMGERVEACATTD